MKFMASILLSAFASSLTSAASGHPNVLTDDSARTRTEAWSSAKTRKPSALSIINDDFEKARAEANKRKLPLFVEVWAPW